MGGLFSRAGTEAYYANYERAFERLEKESGKILDRRVKRRKAMNSCGNIGFWVTAMGFCMAILITAYLQQISTQKWYQKSMTILGAFAVPLVSALLFKAALWLFRVAEARDERFLRKLMDAKRKMVKELKDSTRFDRIQGLIRKYDPDAQPEVVQAPNGAAQFSSGGLRRRQTAPTSALNRDPSMSTPPTLPSSGTLPRTAAAAASAAASVAAGTGKALMPVFDKLATMVGDNPVLLQETLQLRDENQALKARLAEIEARLAPAPGTTDAAPIEETPEKAPSAPLD